MTVDTRFAYEELYAICADLLEAPRPAARRHLLIALRWHLHTRCRRCGSLLPPPSRRGPAPGLATTATSSTAEYQAALDELEGLCERCVSEYIPPPPPGYPQVPDDTDVPF